MTLDDEIRAGISTAKIEAAPLSDSESRATLSALTTSYAAAGRGPLWERLRDAESLQSRDGWKHAGFLDEPARLLVFQGNRVFGYRLRRATDLPKLLEECYGFEFYVTDDEVTYVVVFNHHDMLIGAGRAAAWVRSLRASR